jgi:hypothetical protein
MENVTRDATCRVFWPGEVDVTEDIKITLKAGETTNIPFRPDGPK